MSVGWIGCGAQLDCHLRAVGAATRAAHTRQDLLPGLLRQVLLVKKLPDIFLKMVVDGTTAEGYPFFECAVRRRFG